MDRDKHIDIKGQGNVGLTIKGDTRGRTKIQGNSGLPVYVGAQAKVTRTPEGVKIWLKDYKGETSEIIAEAIEDIITNPDGSLLFVLPDGRTILTDSLMCKDYDLLENKPSINTFTVEGDKTAADYRLQDKMDLITEQMIDNLFYGRT